VTETRVSTQHHCAVPEDPIDFRALVERELSYVWNTLRRLGVRYDDLKDQTQEVFFTVHTLRADYDATRPMRPWLFGIAYRVASRYRSLARNTRELLVEPADVADTRRGAEGDLLARERQRMVLTAIESIDLPRRAVFIMSEIDELPMPQVAEAMAIPLNTAYSRLRLARKEFAAAVRRLQANQGAP
jgi:RNA polymerase sigma-70 factor (ECF subfamily)